MTFSQVALACVLACIAASFSDWFFFGVLFHDSYLAFPEVWRRRPGSGSEGREVCLAVIIGFLTLVCFVFLAWGLHLSGMREVALLAFGAWASVVLPLLVTNYVFMKLHPLIVVSHSLGWLAKLVIAGAAVCWFTR